MPSSGSHSAVVIPVHVLDTPLLPEIFSQFTVALNVVLQAPTPAYSFLKTPVHRGIRFLALFGYGFRAPRAYTTLIKLGLRGTTLGDIVSKTSTVLVSDRASGDHGRAGKSSPVPLIGVYGNYVGDSERMETNLIINVRSLWCEALLYGFEVGDLYGFIALEIFMLLLH